VSDETQTLSMKDALTASMAETGQASPDVASPGVPPVNAQANEAGEQAPKSEGEQLTADTDSQEGFDTELSGLLDSTIEDTQNGSGPGIEPGSDEFWNLGVEVQTVNGPENVTVRDLSEGWMRQADYTKKTQELAAQKEQASQAQEFFSAFQADPEGFARSIGVQAGFLTEGAQPVVSIPSAKIHSQEEIDAIVNEKVESRISEDPRVKDADVVTARAQVDTEFSRLQDAYSIALSPELRESIIQEAIQTNSSDLEGILTKRIVSAQRKQNGSSSPQSTARPGAAPQGATTPESDKTKVNPSMREAWAEAKVAAASSS
jgi:hypothetical protein